MPTGWAVRSISHPIAATTGGVYRVAGTAALRGRTVAWSLVLKVAAPPPTPAGAGAGAWAGGRREALAYASGLLADLPAGLAAPRCFGVEGGEGMDDPAEGAGRLWLEDLAAGGAQGPPFTPAQYRRLARGLGALAGAYLGPRPLPARPWLRRGDARQEHAAGVDRLPALEALRADPLVRVAWPPDVRARVLDGYAAAPALLEALEGYLEGLADQGWRGAPRAVRLGYLLSLGLRYGLLTAPLMLTGDARRRAQVARSFGHPLEALAAVFREEQRYCLDRLDEARALLRAGPG